MALRGTTLTLKSYAKINLFLRILARRPDGYHEIETLLQTVGLHDDIRLARRTDGRLRLACAHPLVPVDERNLCLRAARLLQQTARRTPGADITLVKRIPIGAGLGGGSSNAAVTLLGLGALWRLNLPGPRLAALAGQLGSDVPFFLRGGTAYATGRGEKITQLDDARPRWVVILYPGIHIATEWAYKNHTLDLTKPAQRCKIKCLQNKDSVYFTRTYGNSFELLVFEKYPVIRTCRERLESLGARAALLSGSGSAIYGIFKTRALARRAAAVLKKAWPAMHVFCTRMIGAYQTMESIRR